MQVKKKAHYLGLGVGTAQRERSLARLRSFATITGIDKSRRIGKGIRKVNLVLGKKGEAQAFLRQAAKEGKKWDFVNAEYFFDSIHPRTNVCDLLEHYRSFDLVIKHTQEEERIINAEMKTLFPLIKKVLTRGGVLRMEVREDSLKQNLERLEKYGFVWTRPRELSKEEAISKWGKIYFNKAKKFPEYQPYEIIAVAK